MLCYVCRKRPTIVGRLCEACAFWRAVVNGCLIAVVCGIIFALINQ